MAEPTKSMNSREKMEFWMRAVWMEDSGSAQRIFAVASRVTFTKEVQEKKAFVDMSKAEKMERYMKKVLKDDGGKPTQIFLSALQVGFPRSPDTSEASENDDEETKPAEDNGQKSLREMLHDIAQQATPNKAETVKPAQTRVTKEQSKKKEVGSTVIPVPRSTPRSVIFHNPPSLSPDEELVVQSPSRSRLRRQGSELTKKSAKKPKQNQS